MVARFGIGRAARAALLAALALDAAAAMAQSRTSTTIDGVEITIVGGRSQSVSATAVGADILVDGHVIAIEGAKITVDGSSLEGDPFDAVTIEASDDGLRVLVDGAERFTIARSGGGASLNDQASRLFHGEGVEQDVARGIASFERAYEEDGDLMAADNLARIFWHGLEGVPQDKARALRHAEIAAEEDHFASLFFLGRGHLDGVAPNADPKKGIEHLRRAVEAGSVDAMVDLGVELGRGDHVLPDLAAAAALYRRAAEGGSDMGANNYAWSLWNGEGVEKNPREAVRWAEQAAAGGVKYAMFLLGVAHYFGGDGLAADRPRAFEHFVDAARAGHETAAYNAGLMRRDGDGTERDAPRAVAWMERAVELGHADAPAELARLRAGATADDGAPREDDRAVAAEAAIYWYARDGARVGPVTLGAARAALAEGAFAADDLVWRPGLEEWVQARTLPELAP